MRLNFFSWRSLKTRVTLLTLAIFVLVIWSLAWYASEVLREDMQRQLGEQQLASVALVATHIHDEFEIRLKALEQIAVRITPAMQGQPHTVQTQLEQLPIFQNLFSAGIVVSRPDGQALAQITPSGAPSAIGISRMAATESGDISSVTRASISPPLVHPQLGSPAVVMAVPIRDLQGRTLGSLAGIIRLDQTYFLNKIAQNRYGKTGGYLVISPRYQRIVIASDPQRTMTPAPAPGVNAMHDKYMQGYEGYGVAINSRGVEELTAAKRIPAADWFLVAALPTQEAFASITALRQQLLLATAVLTLLAGVAIWWTVAWALRQQLRPVLSSTRALEHTGPPRNDDELGELIGGFHALRKTSEQSDALHQQIIDTASVAIFLVDLDGRITRANQTMATMFGCELGTLEGAEYVSLVHPSEREEGHRKMLALLASQVQSVDLDRLYWRADHSRFWGRLTGRRFVDAQGVNRGLVGVIADITDRKQVQQYEKFRNEILEMLASNTPLDHILQALAQGVEQLRPDTRCSIDLHGHAPASLATPVANNLALVCPLNWSVCGARPIRTASGEILGTFSLFQPVASAPTEFDVDLIDQSAALASIAIEKSADADKLRDSEDRYRTLVEWSPDPVLVHRFGQILYANAAATHMFGAAHVQALIGCPARQLMPKDVLDAQMERMQSAPTPQTIPPLVESTFLRLDGSAIDVEVQSTPIMYAAQPAMHVSIRDITQRKQAEAHLQLAASVFTHAQEGIFITNLDGSIIDVNAAFTRITGYNREDVLGRNPRLLASGHQNRQFYAALFRELSRQGHWHGEIWNKRKNGEIYVQMLTISKVSNSQGQAQHYVALFSDITAMKDHQNQLEHIAHFDALTGLPNRVLLADRLHQGIAQALRRNQPLAVVFLDLDGFKAINDLHGHEAGDQLLITLAARMKRALRDGDTLARIGGDEFVAVLGDLSDVADSVPMLSRLLNAAAEPVQVNQAVLQVSASLGVTFYPQPLDVDADQLLRQADQAMYQAKLAGKNRYHVFDAAHDDSVRGHHESLEHIRTALREQQFVLHYQPKVNMRTGAVIGAEALIRWQHPERGLLAPGEFLPVIEGDALAITLGEWVIDTALTQMQTWAQAGLHIAVSVNIGARQLQQPNFVERLRGILAQHPPIPVGALELEVLETSALEDVAGVSRVITACKHMGVHFALDDFGTGYSSLTYLKRLPVTLLKVDQSFVRDMLDDPDDLAILEGVIGLASAFRREVIAEGVETLEHGTMLLRLGCELAQGYGIARPMAAHLLPAWTAEWQPAPGWRQISPLQREDFPVLFARVEHRGWSRSMDDFLRGVRDAPPELDHQQCHFGQWLAREGHRRFGELPQLAAIDTLHRQAHALATSLCDLVSDERSAEALAGLPALHTMCDTLLAQLDTLLLPQAATQ